jgi:uncharacterized protein with PIN domain
MIRIQKVSKKHYGYYGMRVCNSCGEYFDSLNMISAIRKVNPVVVESVHSLYLCDRCTEVLRKELNTWNITSIELNLI